MDGTILQMEFLHPLEDDSDHVLLLLIVSKNSTSKLMWFEWNTRTDLHEAQFTPGMYTLPPEYNLPLLLVPLLAFSAFLIVSERHVSICRDILTGTPNVYSITLPKNEEGSEEMVCSKRSPIWVQWARPMRPPAARSSPKGSDDNIYLCREDGIVQYIDIKHSNPYLIDSFHNAGKFGVAINGSFAVVDLGPSADDLLVAGGDSGAGGCWRFSPRKAAERLSTQSNWTPLSDIILDSSASNNDADRGYHYAGVIRPDGRQRVLTCNGKRLHGSVSELCYGIQSSPPSESIDLGDLPSSTILDLWTLCSSQDISYVLISYPTNTAVLQLQEGYDPELLDSTASFDLDSRTIAALVTEEGLAIQVTNSSVTGISLQSPGGTTRLWKHDFWGAGEEGLVASIESTGVCHHLIVAVRKNEDFSLRFGLVGSTYDPTWDITPLTIQPTCIGMNVLNERILVSVGNVQGGLELFVASQEEPHHKLRRVASWQFGLSFEICDSTAILHLDTENEQLDDYLLVCGLRNGQIQTLSFQQGQRKSNSVLHPKVPVLADSIQMNLHS